MLWLLQKKPKIFCKKGKKSQITLHHNLQLHFQEEFSQPNCLSALIAEKRLNLLFCDITVNFPNIRTHKNFFVITLKFELCGSTIE